MKRCDKSAGYGRKERERDRNEECKAPRVKSTLLRLYVTLDRGMNIQDIPATSRIRLLLYEFFGRILNAIEYPSPPAFLRRRSVQLYLINHAGHLYV